MGTSHSRNCNHIVKNIWLWAKERNIWLSDSHIPGKLNVETDLKSHEKSKPTKWMLDKCIFNDAMQRLSFKRNIDLFASRINYQLKSFVSF